MTYDSELTQGQSKRGASGERRSLGERVRAGVHRAAERPPVEEGRVGAGDVPKIAPVKRSDWASGGMVVLLGNVCGGQSPKHDIRGLGTVARTGR